MDERSEPLSRQHHHRRGMGAGGKLVLAAMVVGGAAYAWWHWRGAPAQEQPPATAVAAAVDPIAPALPAAEPAPQEAVVSPPPAIEPAPDAQGNPPLAAEDGAALEQAVTAWLGRERSLRFVASQGLAQRIVATIDNLPRSQAPTRMWPLHPVGGRMQVLQTDDGGMVIAAENAARYEDVVRFVVGLDVDQAVVLYRNIYPVLQHAYEALGFPGQRFNDRLVAVVDHLLQTPEPAGAVALTVVQVQGKAAASKPLQPWLRYEFADAELQALSAGQKILVRMGVGHMQRIKAQLRALRAHLAPK